MKRPFIRCFRTYWFMVSLDLTRLPVLMVSECIPNCGLLVCKVPSIYGEEENESHSNCWHRKCCLKEQKMDLKVKGNIKCTNGWPPLLKFFKQIYPWCCCFEKILASCRWKIPLKLAPELSFPSVRIDTLLMKVGPCLSNLVTQVQMCRWSHGAGRGRRGRSLLPIAGGQSRIVEIARSKVPRLLPRAGWQKEIKVHKHM